MEFRTDREILAQLGQRAKAARRRQKIGQESLAHKAGVSRDTLQRFETSGTSTIANLVKICRVLGVIDQIDLIFEEPHFSPQKEFEKIAAKKG